MKETPQPRLAIAQNTPPDTFSLIPPRQLPPSKFLVFMPTYAPETEAVEEVPGGNRSYSRCSNEEIINRVNTKGILARLRPWVYMDCVDSILNIRQDVDLVVADARSTNSIRRHMAKHQAASIGLDHAGYDLALFENKESQWKALNKILEIQLQPHHEFLVYTSSDVVWVMDWVAEAEKEFAKDPSLQIIFPCVSSGDPNLPCQIAQGARDLPLLDPPYQQAARAPVLNGYAFIMRTEFLRRYGGYPTIFRNCYTESFLYYMCEAYGGKMRLMPRGWVYHFGAMDAHEGDGGKYNHLGEFPVFERVMNEVQAARSEGRATVDFLRSQLYEQSPPPAPAQQPEPVPPQQESAA